MTMPAMLAAMLLAPALGALIQALVGRFLPRRLSGLLACLAIFCSLAMALAAVVSAHGQTWSVNLADWFSAGGFTARASLLYDPLAQVMALTVTFVASLIHIYSLTYMREDESYGRYFCYMNMFVFFMLVITLADDLVFLFLGWEGVGFCSYALIGFWNQEWANVNAGNKAFILTRIGDLGLVAALALLSLNMGQVSISQVIAQAPSFSLPLATLLGFLVLLGAVGKSGQLPLSVWLPDAMAGPTPVSALIHAATMVTAGVYLLMRLYPLLAQSPIVLAAVALVGGLTALYGALSALGQRDIKRILAYSTISQVGYMFLAVGCGDVTGGMFHLVSHAFFKSLLFMAAGCLIQALHEEHDIYRMGRRLRRELPGVFVLFLAGAVSLAAMPFTAGFFSKGRILADALSRPGWPYGLSAVMALAAALITAVYIFRLVFVAFWNDPADPVPRHADPAIARMTWPLWPLGLLALVAGGLDLPPFMGGVPWLDHVLAHVPGGSTELEHSLEIMVAGADVALALVGLCLAWIFYGPGKAQVGPKPGVLTAGLGLDNLYAKAVTGPYKIMSRVLWRGVDHQILDQGVTDAAGFFMMVSLGLKRLATGRISTSMAGILAAMAAALIYLAGRQF